MSTIKNDERNANSSKRLPIAFCLDISPSMSWEQHGFIPMDLLNESVGQFIHDICANSKAKAAAEVSFVTFSSKVEQVTEFAAARKYQNNLPQFSSVEVGGTQMATAVHRCIDKIEQRVEDYKSKHLKYYVPFLVIITDGIDNDDPALREQAIQRVNLLCQENKLIPFVIGIGDEVDPDILNQYAKGGVDGYFPVKGGDAMRKFADAIQIVSMSAISTTKGETISNQKVILEDFYDRFMNA